MGRRTRAVEWIGGLGARPPQVRGRGQGIRLLHPLLHRAGSGPAAWDPPLIPLGSVSVLTLDGDNDTWSVTVFTVTGDAPLKALRHDDCFDRVVRACPLQAHWLDGEPITSVLAMAGVLDRVHRFVVDGRPVATGFAAVGDAWACTNPSAGRGLSVGMLHAQVLRQVVAAHLARPGDVRPGVGRADRRRGRALRPEPDARPTATGSPR